MCGKHLRRPYSNTISGKFRRGICVTGMLAVLVAASSTHVAAQAGQDITNDDVFSCVLVNYWLYKFSVDAIEQDAKPYIRQKCADQLGLEIDAGFVAGFVDSIETESPEQFEAKIGPRNREIMARVMPPLMETIKRISGKLDQAVPLR